MNMKRMSKWVFAASVVLAAAGARAGDSAPFALDTRTGTRIARGTEPIAYSTEWNRGADVQVFVDGELLKAATAPATGVVVWDVSEADGGVHTLTHVSGGVTLTAEFVVQGVWVESADPMKGSITLAWTDAEAGNGVTYSIYRGAEENRSEAELVAPTVTEATWTDENYWTAEPALKPLNYWVVANDSGGGERESKPVQTRRRFGVFVGLSDFAPERKEKRLPAPAKEAEALRNLFVDHGGVLETNVVLITNSDANWSAVSRSIAAKAKDSQPGDLFVFYIATHGTYSGGKGKLLFYDRLVPMEEFFSVLGEFNSGTVVIPVLMACHSGAFVDYANGALTLVDTSEGFKAFVTNGLAMCRANMPVLASCGAEEGSDDAGTYTDFGEAFILEGWRNGYADGEVHGVGHGGGNGDGYVSFLELIQYARAFARGRTDAHRAHVQWSSNHVEYEWLLRDTLAGQVPQGETCPTVPDMPEISAVLQNEEQNADWFGASLLGLCVDNAKRYWCYVLKEGRNVHSEDEDDWECVDYRGVKAPNLDKFLCRNRLVLLGKIDRYRVRAVNGAGASGFSEVVELNDGDTMDFVQMTMTGPGQLTFRWKALCEEGEPNSGESEAELWVRDSEGVNARKASLSEVAEWKTVGPVNFRSNCEYPLQWVRTGNYPVQVELLEWKQTKSAAMGGVTWQYTDDGEESTVMGGEVEGDVEIPAELEGMTVTAVGALAFAEQVSLFALTVPDSVESIGDGAFAGCSGLTFVDLGNGVATIGEGAFAGCSSLTSMTIPASVTSLGSQVFEGCSSLASLYVPAAWEGTGMLEGAGLPEGCEVVYGSGAEKKPDLGFWVPEEWPAEVYLARSVYGLEAATEFAAGEEFFLCCGLRNSGDMNAENCHALVRVTDSDGNEVSSWSFPSFGLNAGVFVWARAANIMEDGTGLTSIAKPGEYTLEFILDPEGLIDESDESDNCWTLTFTVLPPMQHVTYDANGGTCELAEGIFVIGETYGELPVATWTGHSFQGWWTAKSGGTKVTAASEVTPEGERTLYAHWKVTSWQTVTFDANGGKCGTKTKKFAVAETYSPLPTATRTGQALLGWFTAKSGGTKVTAASVVTTASKRTLYAHWTTKQTAKFDANGGACTTKSKTCTIGKAYGTLPAATQAGQAFTGWFSAKTGGSKVTASTKVTAVTPRTLYAHWTTKQKVTFDANGGKCGTKSAVRAIGGTYGDLPVPTRSGQAFTGWFTAKKGGSKVAATTKVNAAAARTLHAHWTTTQTAQFDANGGTCTTKSKTYTIGKTYGTLPTATLAGNGFVAWYTAKTGGSKVAASSKVTAVTPLKLYAHWTTKQKVTFDANGGKCGTKSVVRAIGGTYGDLPVPTRSGQAFTGWFTAKTGGSKVAASTKVTAAAARTLHAHWTTTQTVTFDANGGTCKTKSKNFTIAKKYGTLPTPTWKGRTFAGWFSAKTGGTKVTAASTATAVASRTLYAHWAEQTVTFDANGGTCETATAKYVRGGPYKPLPVATRQDFGFGGWWTAANGGTKVTEFTTVTSSGTRTLHAHWGEPGTKFAVCVGINKYKSGFAEDLDGCVNDATVFRRNLVTLGEWQETNTVLLLNANATKTAIRKAISNCAARAVAGDTFVYQHSSHGGQNDGTSVFICGYDSDYQDTELAADLRAFASGVKVVVVVDACNSGGLFAGASAKAVRRSAPQFDLAGRVTALMDAERHARRARGEPVAKSLSSSEIGWVTSAHWNEDSMEGGYYDHPRWMTGNATTADTWDLIGGVFMTAATWGWWDGSCDTDAKAGDGDGCCDAYEFWKKGRDCAIRCGTIWDDPSMNFTPQCTNVTVLRSVELGVAGARPKSGLAGKSVRDEELGTRNAAGREFAIYSFSMDANGVATSRGGRETDGCAGTLEFVAVAGTAYELQWTAALGGEWTTVRRWVAETDGACEVALPAQEESTGFFRLAAP